MPVSCAFLVTLLACSDVKSIDRMIAKQPVCHGKPGYALVTFGREPTTRVWLLLDGPKTLYVDLNADGDVTEPGKCFAGKEKTVQLSTGETRYFDYDLGITRLTSGRQLRVTLSQVTDFGNGGGPLAGKLVVQDADKLQYYAPLVFGATSKDAPLIHIAGRLEMTLAPGRNHRLAGAEYGRQLYVMIATPGAGDSGLPWLLTNCVPPNVYPVAEVTFPNKDPKAPAIKKRFVLKERC